MYLSECIYLPGACAFVMGSSGLFFKESDIETNCKRMKSEFSQATVAAL
jgi:hypothetical protein